MHACCRSSGIEAREAEVARLAKDDLETVDSNRKRIQALRQRPPNSLQDMYSIVSLLDQQTLPTFRVSFLMGRVAESPIRADRRWRGQRQCAHRHRTGLRPIVVTHDVTCFCAGTRNAQAGCGRQRKR